MTKSKRIEVHLSIGLPHERHDRVAMISKFDLVEPSVDVIRYGVERKRQGDHTHECLKSEPFHLNFLQNLLSAAPLMSGPFGGARR